MKKLGIVVLAFFAISYTFGQGFLKGSGGRKALKIEEVREVGLNKAFRLLNTNSSVLLPSGLEVLIEPIDASTLDEEFYKNNLYNGKYNDIFFESNTKKHFLEKKKRRRKYIKGENEFLFEGLYWLMDNDIIDELMFEELQYEISLGDDELEEFSIYSSNNKKRFNPYFYNDKYLNLFRITVTNPTSKAINNNINLQVFNGGEQLNALEAGAYAGVYSQYKIRAENLLRADFSKIKLFPAKQKTTKYFAAFPLNLLDSKIEVSVVENNSDTKTLSWNADIKREEIYNTVNYYELILKPSAGTFRSYYIVMGENQDVYVVDNYLYIKESDLDKPITLFYFGMKSKRLYYGITDEFTPTEFIDFKD